MVMVMVTAETSSGWWMGAGYRMLVRGRTEARGHEVDMATAWILQRMDAAEERSSQHMTAVRCDCEFVACQSQNLFSHHFIHYSFISEASNLSPMYAKTWPI